MATEPRQPAPITDLRAEAIELAAAEWLVEQDHGLDPVRQREFERWLDADEHAAAYARLKETWHLLDDVPADRVPLPPHRGRRWWWVTGAIAAAAAAVVVALVRPGTTAPRRMKAVDTATTAIGGFETLKLVDGSIVRLNTATELAVDFTAGERRVALLHGEASFEVTKDPSRPFVVRVGGVDVRVVGTVFNVRQSDEAIDVLVTEGKVRIEDAISGQTALPADPSAQNAPSSPVLVAGQRATIARGTAPVLAKASVARVDPEESSRVLAWHSRQLEFSNEPLANIAAEFNRYNRHRLVIDDAELGSRRFGGTFPSDDSAALIRLLELNFSVVVERRENETVLRLRRTDR